MIDLSVGNPSCLESYWADKPWPQFEGDTVTLYPNPEGDAWLKDEIKNLHQHVGNVSDLRHYEVVVGNGASQLMQAALASFPEQGDRTFVYAKPPHFPRFYDFVKMSGNQTFKFMPSLDFVTGERTIEIVTMPNNPNNAQYGAVTKSPYKIYDCSYLWPQYSGARLPDPQPRIMVFSLAKALGLANLRIGWALVYDSQVAKKMRDFVEKQSGGLSAASAQMASAAILDQLNRFKDDTAIKAMGDVLEHRWLIIKDKFKDLKNVELLNSSGMFLWLKYKEGAASLDAQLGVRGAHGPAFGASRFHVRYNIGCRNEHFDFLLEQLVKIG